MNSLPHDIARCPGVGSHADGWREGCETCLCRTAPAGPNSPYMEPPAIIASWCEYLIEPGEQETLRPDESDRKNHATN